MRLIHPLTAAALAAASLALAAPATAQGRPMGDSVRGGGAGKPTASIPGMRDVVRSARHGQGRGHHYRHRRWQQEWDQLGWWPDAPPGDGWTLPGSEGFFGDGEAVSDGSRVVYDYDRSYPYRHYRQRGAALASTAQRGGGYRCEVEWVPPGRGRADAAVRVCRR